MLISKEEIENKILISIALNLSKYPNKVPCVQLERIEYYEGKKVSSTILIFIKFGFFFLVINYNIPIIKYISVYILIFTSIIILCFHDFSTIK